ncbi:hypothetical protein CI109_106453 [Kwoniella shandongensis]|uniref:Uncharacterized protein n=1 Tax=Kwoniella shandongensis TaxID=1734106 RepID=A0A5M6C166_9TREE|nr:uncharacterized protein CI109_002635 [Kwoniella shandongensis]KAA5528878.1 hypothetical protein CI109_002635 [Kwoniella shandongensis]
MSSLQQSRANSVEGEKRPNDINNDNNDLNDRNDRNDINNENIDDSKTNTDIDTDVDTHSRRSSDAPSLDSRSGSISSEGSSDLCTPTSSRASSLDLPATIFPTCHDQRSKKESVQVPSDCHRQSKTLSVANVICTPPNARLAQRGYIPLSEPSASLLRPTTFWRHHPLSPHALPHHSPSSRLIRRSILIASPTISVQQPNPDAETTRIAIGLAGIDLDIDPRRFRKLSIVPT